MPRIDWTYDEIVLAADLSYRHGWIGLDRDHPEIMALSSLLKRARIHPTELRDATFRNPNGVGRKTWDIATQHPHYSGKQTKGNRLDSEVLQAYLEDPDGMAERAAAIRDAIEQNELPPLPIDVDDFDVHEGALLVGRHLRRERDPGLRRRKIAAVKAAGLPIACEVCRFDFEQTYGERGSGYIEVHHVLPLHISGEARTRLGDLALLCSNCHRMIHRSPWTTPGALRREVRG